MSTCHCSTCDEPATTACATCLAMRQALVEFYADRVEMYQGQADDFALMGRTVQYLDEAGVRLEYADRIRSNK